MTDRDVADMFNLTDRVVVVTGGSRGLGREMALACARAGADVVIASRKLDACEGVADEVRALGRNALAVQFHAGKWEDADRLVETVYGEFGRADVLISNAGMAPLYPSIDQATEALYDKTMEVNLKGPFRLSALFGTRMKEAGNGSIVFISSMGSQIPTPDDLIYCAAKAGLNSLTYGLARTLGPEVRVNCILPGPFLTDISSAWDLEAFDAKAPSKFAMARAGSPHEIAGAALYFASDASSYTTGALLNVDGGPK